MSKYKVIFSIRRSENYMYGENIGVVSKRANDICKLYNKNVIETHRKMGWTWEVFSITPEKGEKLIMDA